MAKILIVDDSMMARNSLRYVLQTAGYEVLEATDGADALVCVEEERPDCIAVDLLMPNMDGMAFLDAMNERGLGTPVIVITADVQGTTHKACLDRGAAAILPKPVKPAGVREAVRRALKGTWGGAA